MFIPFPSYKHPTNISFYSELNQITGIAAILTFPLDVEVVEAEEREAKEEEARKKQEAGEMS